MRIFLSLLISLIPLLCFAQEESIEASPKDGWGEFQVVEKKEQTILTKVLLWLPNRVLDFVDIFRADVGVGLSKGGVIRVSEHMQAGYRDMSPSSLRVGVFGRDYPWLMETSSEFGVSPTFTQSKDRSVCPSEVGAGVDLFIIGGYGGICLAEIFDFAAGIFMIDLQDDDY